MLIDCFVPTYQFVERHSRTISAAPPRVYRALWEADFARSTVIRTLFMIRGLTPAFRQEGSLQIRLADFLRAGFLLLGERTGEELVVGVLWGRASQAVTPEQFIELDEPRHTKVAMNFAMRPHDTGTLVTTETRAFSIDEGARRKFARYWLIIRPFSGLIRRRMLAVLHDQVLRSLGHRDADRR